MPGALRRAMLDDDTFLRKFGISVDASISFDRGVADFSASGLFAAIREAERSRSTVTLQDKTGEEWLLELPDLPASGHAVLSKKDVQLTYGDAAYLLSDPAIRVATLTSARNRLALPDAIINRWGAILKERPLLDKEAAALHDDLASGPVRFADELHRAIESGESSIDLLVPGTRAYYEQMIGELSSSTSVQEHASLGLTSRARELIEWDERKGLLHCLLLSSHPAFTAAIPVERIAIQTILDVLRFLRGSGERLCQLGAVEICLRILPLHPELESDLVSLIEEIRDDDPTSERSGFRIMSDLFIFADAQMGRRRTLGLAPPFYRRMAAFAQSALILRGIRESSADAASLCTWSRKNCTGQFYLQSLADMRLEPRWYPDLLQASQLKAEVCGRLILAGHGAEKDLPPRLADLLLLTSKQSDSLKMKIDAPGFFFPGPLEGATDYRRDLPEALRRAIDEQIGASELGANSFIALVNSVDMFSIVDDIPGRVSEVLRNGRYHLHHLKDHAQLMIVLLGLARVAAVCRSASLAHELRVLVRRYRHDAQFTLSLDDAFRVILFAAAAFTDLIEWAKFVGDNLRELAFSEVSEEDAAALHSQMHVLCVAVPELWIAVGRADAALASINS